MKYSIYILLFLIIIGESLVCGQVKGDNSASLSNLTVRVTEEGKDESIYMATVYIVPSGDTIATAFTFTDKKGFASLISFPAGRYVLNVQMFGFKPYKKELVFESKRTTNLSVALEEDLKELEGASITEMGDLVTVNGDTLIYNATSFRTSSDATLGDLLKKMPGIEVESGRVKVDGEFVKRITVEGKTFFFGDQSKALENLPAAIVNKIKVIERENHGRTGFAQKEKEMDIRLKDEFRKSWFGKVSAEGGASIKDNSSEVFNDGTKRLYNAKLYAQYYGDNDQITILGGGNNVNAKQLTRSTSGISDVASMGMDYHTSRIPNLKTNASTSYDFRRNDNRSESHRTSFLTSGDRLIKDSQRNSMDMNNSVKASFGIGNQVGGTRSDGFSIDGSFLYNRKLFDAKSISSTRNDAREELNSSESRKTGKSNDFAALINSSGYYRFGKGNAHEISFGATFNYNGCRGNSQESSVAFIRSSNDFRSLLYNELSDGIGLNGFLTYSVPLSKLFGVKATVSADYNSLDEKRDAENNETHIRDDYYSKYTLDKSISILEKVNVEYSNKKTFGATIGLRVYEDNSTHLSRAFGSLKNSDNKWQVNVGPEASIVFWKSKNTYSISTDGRSIVPSNGPNSSPVLDISNPIDISTGNIYLKSGYRQDVRLSSVIWPHKGGRLSLGIIGSVCYNELTMASWVDSSALRYSIPVNSHRPRYSANLNISYLKPLNEKKSLNLTVTPVASLSAGTFYFSNGLLRSLDKDTFDYDKMMKWFYGDRNGSEFYSGRSGFIENRSLNLNWSLKMDLKYEIWAYSIRSGAFVNNSRIEYSASPAAKVKNWRFNAYSEVLWQNKTGWEAEARFDFNGYSGFSANYNRPEYLLNLKLAKVLKSFTLSLSAYDIFGSAKSFSHTSSAEFVEDTYRNNIGRCILVGLSYNFGKLDLMKKTIIRQKEKNNNL